MTYDDGQWLIIASSYESWGYPKLASDDFRENPIEDGWWLGVAPLIFKPPYQKDQKVSIYYSYIQI